LDFFNAEPSLSLPSVFEDGGIRVELVDQKDQSGGGPYANEGDIIQLLLRIVDPSKRRRSQQKENEAIQFEYNIGADNPEDVAREMVILLFTNNG